MLGLKIFKNHEPKQKELKNLGFGQIFTDHMFVMDYTEGKGWHDPRIEPYGNISLDPSATVLHYGQAIFEGLKAYKTFDDKIHLFRPRDNFERLNRSAKSLCIPEIDVDFALNALLQLVELEKDWIPSEPGTSLYIRPYIISTEAFLGVKPSNTYKFIIILSPVGAYYPEGFKPVKILVEEKHVRAVRGGLGEAKTMANYAASLLAGEEAKVKGYSQVLWLDGIDLKYIEEVGTMNIFFKIKGEVITPPLSGSILPGITRDSIIKLLGNWQIPVRQERLSIDDIFNAYHNDQLEEVFGTGTAAVISPVGELSYKNSKLYLKEYGEESLVQKLYDYLTGIQYGTVEDEFEWIETIG